MEYMIGSGVASSFDAISSTFSCGETSERRDQSTTSVRTWIGLFTCICSWPCCDYWRWRPCWSRQENMPTIERRHSHQGLLGGNDIESCSLLESRNAKEPNIEDKRRCTLRQERYNFQLIKQPSLEKGHCLGVKNLSRQGCWKERFWMKIRVWTSISFVHLSVDVVRTLAYVYIYTADAVLHADGFLLSMGTVKIVSAQMWDGVRTDGLHPYKYRRSGVCDYVCAGWPPSPRPPHSPAWTR